MGISLTFGGGALAANFMWGSAIGVGCGLAAKIIKDNNENSNVARAFDQIGTKISNHSNDIQNNINRSKTTVNTLYNNNNNNSSLNIGKTSNNKINFDDCFSIKSSNLKQTNNNKNLNNKKNSTLKSNKKNNSNSIKLNKSFTFNKSDNNNNNKNTYNTYNNTSFNFYNPNDNSDIYRNKLKEYCSYNKESNFSKFNTLNSNSNKLYRNNSFANFNSNNSYDYNNFDLNFNDNSFDFSLNKSNNKKNIFGNDTIYKNNYDRLYDQCKYNSFSTKNISSNYTYSEKKEIAYNLLSDEGLTNAGICAILGNLQCESRLESARYEDGYKNKIGMTDKEYVNNVNSGKYTNFINDRVGFGLAQWTTKDRKKALLNYCNGDIGNFEKQMKFLIHELKTSYPGIWNKLKTSNNLRELTNLILKSYERPMGYQTIEVQNRRYNNAKIFYDEFKNNYKNYY